MIHQSPNDPLTQEIQRLRADYEAKKARSNLGSAGGRRLIDLSLGLIDGVFCYTYWYEHQCIRLADITGTISGDVLRLQQNLPDSVDNGDHEIIGDQVRPLVNVPPLPELDDDSEELDTILAMLPIVEFDPSKYLIKKGKHKSEICNLLECQGGSCPGVPKSSHIIQLLGKSPEGKLVFEKFKSRFVLGYIYTLNVYKDWLLQIISGMKTLHSFGIIHRDLRIDNIVFSSDTSRVLICDLEGRWGNRLAPEVSREPVLDAGWTTRSDIYDFGYLIKGMIYGNVPVTMAVEWPVPNPLAAVVEACTRNKPEERPCLDDLYAMLEKIEITT